MEYNKIFKPSTLAKLNKKSQENLKSMLGDKTLMQTMIQSQELLNDISKAEAPYKEQLEQLAIQMIEDLYPIVEEEGIRLDAKIVSMSDIHSELDEIKVNPPGLKLPIKIESEEQLKQVFNQLKNQGYKWFHGGEIRIKDVPFSSYIRPIYIEEKPNKEITYGFKPSPDNPLYEQISPEGRRRIINSLTQGAALRGSFAFYLFKDYLDAIDPSLIDKYNQIMKNSFGVYDDDNAIAMMLSALAQGQKAAGGSSKVIINEIKVNSPNKVDQSKELEKIISKLEDEYPNHNDTKIFNLANKEFKRKFGHGVGEKLNEQQESGITIRARALNFPMLVHELIKGLYELVSLQGFKGDKEANQGVVDKVDKLKHEPHDIKYGKLIFDALNDIFADSPHSDPRIREFFFSEVYQLEDDEFLDFVENAINEELTPKQKRWVDSTLKEISFDLKADDYDQEGIDEIKVNNPESIKFENLKIGDVYSFKIKNGNMEKLIIVNKTPNKLNPYSKPAIVGNRNINNEDDDDNNHYLTIYKDDIINIKNI